MTKKTTNPDGDVSISQSDIVAIAAFLAGATRKPVDMEDIAVKANEIAPGRFAWKKYKDQIDLELIYKHLWDLTKPDKGAYVIGSKNEGWMLTLAGTAFAEKAVVTIQGLNLGATKLSAKDKERLKRDRARMLMEPAYAKISSGRSDEVTRIEAERFFRLDDYVIGEARERKIAQAENAFHDDRQLGPVVARAAQLVRTKV